MIRMVLPAKTVFNYLKAAANKPTRFPQTINNFE